MLAALLLNLGGQQPPPPVARPRFGGGPFWRRYGYDRAYDDIRDQTTSSALEQLPSYDEPAVVRRPVLGRPKINYRAINARVAESVAKDMRAFQAEEIARRVAEQEDEEIEVIMLMMLN